MGHCVIYTQNHFGIYRIISHCSIIFAGFLFPVNAAEKQTSVVVFHTIQSTCKKNNVLCHLQGHNDLADNEPATLISLTWHSNHVSYAAACSYSSLISVLLIININHCAAAMQYDFFAT